MDGLMDHSLIRGNQIKLSSNENAVDKIRPGGGGWSPDIGDKQPSVTFSIGDAFKYGGNIQLPMAKNIKSFDVILSGDKKPLTLKVSFV